MATLADDLYNGDNYLGGLDGEQEPIDVELVKEEPLTKGKGHKVTHIELP